MPMASEPRSAPEPTVWRDPGARFFLADPLLGLQCLDREEAGGETGVSVLESGQARAGGRA
jgi:hypothetical protein